MAQRLSGEASNIKFDSQRPEKEVTTSTIGIKTGLDTRSYVSFNDGYNLDGFGRLRVSEPVTIFDSKQIFDNQPLFFDDKEVSGSGTSSTHSIYTASSIIKVSANTIGKRVRQTFMRFNYQSGKSLLINCTGVLCKSGGSDGITRAFGYFDDNNGVFLRDNKGTIEIVVRSNVSETPIDLAIAQSEWNVDKMDGTGDSGITMDFTKSQILFIDLEWLGVGRVRVGFVIDGNIYYTHYFNFANNIIGVYMRTPNLPIRYEIEADGTNTEDAELEHICSSIMVEGGSTKLGVLRHYNSPQLSNLTTGTKYIFMAGRLKADSIDATIEIENISIISNTQSDNAKWELYAGGIYSGTLTFTDFSHSRVQIADGDKTQIYTTNGGIVIDGGYFTSSQPITNQISNALKLGSLIDGTPQEFYFVVTPLTNNITIEASITWRELS